MDQSQQSGIKIVEVVLASSTNLRYFIILTKAIHNVMLF